MRYAQPMHAYDLDTMNREDYSKEGRRRRKVYTLDGQERELVIQCL